MCLPLEWRVGQDQPLRWRLHWMLSCVLGGQGRPPLQGLAIPIGLFRRFWCNFSLGYFCRFCRLCRLRLGRIFCLRLLLVGLRFRSLLLDRLFQFPQLKSRLLQLTHSHLILFFGLLRLRFWLLCMLNIRLLLL